MIDQRLGIDIVFILNLSRMKSVYVVLYSIPSQTLNVEKNSHGMKWVYPQYLFDVLCQRDGLEKVPRCRFIRSLVGVKKGTYFKMSPPVVCGSRK